jgi:hypothetical protein
MGPNDTPAPAAAAPQDQAQQPGSPDAGGAPQKMTGDQAKQVTQAISQKATDVVNGMRELGYVLTQLGVPKDQISALAQVFQSFVDQLQSILGGGQQAAPGGSEPAEQGQPEVKGGNAPVDEQSAGRGVPMM